MQLHQIQYVLKVHELGSFSKAAKAMFVTQPTLSQQIRCLEDELKIRLFIRMPRMISLTDAGVEFVAYGRRIVNELNGLAQTMGSFASESMGRIRIGALWIFGYLGISENITDFGTKHPEIEISMKVSGSADLLTMLQERELDAVYCIGGGKQFHNPELASMKIMTNKVCALIPAGHHLAKKGTLHFSELSGENILTPSADTNLRAILDNYFQRFDIAPKVVCESSQPDVTVACVANGMGIGFLSEPIALALDNGKYVIRPLSPGIDRSIHFVTLKKMQDIPSVRKLVRHVRESY